MVMPNFHTMILMTADESLKDRVALKRTPWLNRYVNNADKGYDNSEKTINPNASVPVLFIRR